ncbi:MAG: hypothetical protein ACO29D_08260, partial [Ilumatobacteraceae bacterium]
MPRANRMPSLRLGLRARIVMYFSLATFIGVVILSVVTFAATRSYLLDKATASARSQAIANAQLVRSLVGSARADAGEVVTNLRTEAGGYAVLHLGTEDLFYAQAPLRFTQSNLPPSFVRNAINGVSGVQRVEFNGRPFEAVAVSIPVIEATYFEVFPIDDVADTLGTIRSTLIAAVLGITIVAGLIGFLLSGNVLLPLRRVTAAAKTIAEGALETRLESERDPAAYDAMVARLVETLLFALAAAGALPAAGATLEPPAPPSSMEPAPSQPEGAASSTYLEPVVEESGSLSRAAQINDKGELEL